MSYSYRHEEIPINLKLDKLETMRRHALALKILLGNDMESLKLQDGDVVNVSWKLVCDYLGDAAIKLEAICSICDDPDVVVDAECDALIEGKVLVYEVLHKLKKLIKKVNKRKAKARWSAYREERGI